MGISRGRSMACELHTSLHNFMRLFSFPCVGNAGLPPLNLYARVPLSMCTLHTRPRVQRAPGLPCALFYLRVRTFHANLGRIRAARSRRRVKHFVARRPPQSDEAKRLYVEDAG